MKLKEKYNWRSDVKIFSIADAVEKDLDRSDYDRGRLEEVEATTTNVVVFLGKLTERLFDKGLLSKEDVTALLSDFEEAAE